MVGAAAGTGNAADGSSTPTLTASADPTRATSAGGTSTDSAHGGAAVAAGPDDLGEVTWNRGDDGLDEHRRDVGRTARWRDDQHQPRLLAQSDGHLPGRHLDRHQHAVGVDERLGLEAVVDEQRIGGETHPRVLADDEAAVARRPEGDVVVGGDRHDLEVGAGDLLTGEHRAVDRQDLGAIAEARVEGDGGDHRRHHEERPGQRPHGPVRAEAQAAGSGELGGGRSGAGRRTVADGGRVLPDQRH